MKLYIEKRQLNEQPSQILRRAGYGFIIDRRSGKESFIRRLGRDHYPRFHVYIEETPDKAVFDMHLDQKQSSYPGAHAHNAEYGGPLVEKEINRLKDLVSRNNQHDTIKAKSETLEKRSLFKKLFK